MQESDNTVDAPPELEFNTQVFGLNFSPVDDVVACGNIDGYVNV